MKSSQKKILLVVIGVLIFCLFCCGATALAAVYYNNYINDNPVNPSDNPIFVYSSTKTPATAKLVAAASKQTVKSTRYCRALADADWAFTSNDQATGADLFSPDNTYHAGWGIAGIYKTFYPTVESFITYFMDLAGYGNISMTEPQDFAFGFLTRDFTGENSRSGVLVYKVYNFDSASGVYVVSVYMADTPTALWETLGGKAQLAMMSIRCVSQLRPSTPSVSTGSDPSKVSDNPEVDLSDKWQEAIMGFENVYSPTTGEHYQPSTSDYWSTGPDGGGYYRELPGGGYEKLENGYGDY